MHTWMNFLYKNWQLILSHRDADGSLAEEVSCVTSKWKRLKALEKQSRRWQKQRMSFISESRRLQHRFHFDSRLRFVNTSMFLETRYGVRIKRVRSIVIEADRSNQTLGVEGVGWGKSCKRIVSELTETMRWIWLYPRGKTGRSSITRKSRCIEGIPRFVNRRSWNDGPARNADFLA